MNVMNRSAYCCGSTDEISRASCLKPLKKVSRFFFVLYCWRMSIIPAGVDHGAACASVSVAAPRANKLAEQASKQASGSDNAPVK